MEGFCDIHFTRCDFNAVGKKHNIDSHYKMEIKYQESNFRHELYSVRSANFVEIRLIKLSQFKI